MYEKISKEIISFGDIETKKRKFHHRKNVILSEDVDIDNIYTIMHNAYKNECLCVFLLMYILNKSINR